MQGVNSHARFTPTCAVGFLTFTPIRSLIPPQFTDQHSILAEVIMLVNSV